jgi:hypothetical protein
MMAGAILLAAAATATSCDLRAATTASTVHEALAQRWLGLSAQPRGLVKWIAGRLIMPLREAAG